jgi:hypothetical protein
MYTKSTEWFVEDQAVSPSYDSRFFPLPLHPSPVTVSKLDRRHTGRLRKRDNLTGEGGGEGDGAKLYDGEKALSSIRK